MFNDRPSNDPQTGKKVSYTSYKYLIQRNLIVLALDGQWKRLIRLTVRRNRKYKERLVLLLHNPIHNQCKNLRESFKKNQKDMLRERRRLKDMNNLFKNSLLSHNVEKILFRL